MKMDSQLKVAASLWFDNRALEAAEFYTSLFADSRIISSSGLQEGPGSGPSVVEFELAGQRFIAFDGAAAIPFTPAISFTIFCSSQEEIDLFWNGFSEGGEPVQGGWITDKFGISWQVIPEELTALMEKAPAPVTRELLTMKKIDIERLRAAALSW